MESRLRVLFLSVAMISLWGCAANNSSAPSTAEAPGQVIDPEVERQDIKEPAIDSENWEIGAFAGVMSIEDFGTDLSYGLRVAYHVTEGFFVEGTAGYSRAGETSFEILSGGATLISEDERDLYYYNLNVGYNLLPGEAFVGEGRAYNNSLYLIAGLGSTTFAGDDRFTVNFGAGYRLILTDSVALRLDFRDHLFDIDIIGEEKTAHNLEATIGVTVFF